MHPLKRMSDEGTEHAKAIAIIQDCYSPPSHESNNNNDNNTSTSKPSLRSKKSSHLAFLKIFNKLRSPDNSDDEDGDDLDFGCSGLHSLLEGGQDTVSLDDLHISNDPQHLHSLGDGLASVELPSRSASIADSMNSSISSINLSSSDCTRSTPPTSYSQSASARSSFSSLTSPTSPNSVSIHNNSIQQKCYITQAQLSSPSSKTRSNSIQNTTTSVSNILSDSIQEEAEETEDETVEQAILRRKQEEEAAIEALEAYFAFRRASDTDPSSDKEQVQPATEIITSSNNASIECPSGNQYGRRPSSPTLLPYAAPYFETYANDPLPRLSLKNYSDTSFSSSSADCTLPSSPVPEAPAFPQPTRLADTSISNHPATSSKQAIIFPRPPLRTRRSEASLRDPIYTENGTGRRRPSLAPSMTCLNTRPRGLTFSNSSPSLIRLGMEIRQTGHLPSIPSTPTALHPSFSSSSSTSSSSATTPTTPNTQIVSYKENTPTSSNFLDLDLSPERLNYKIGHVLPSPPRSSSLAPASGWPKHSLPPFTSNSTTRCQPFVGMREENTIPTSPTRVDFEPNSEYHGSLESYRFPMRSIASTPVISRSSSLMDLCNDNPNSENGLPTIPKVHSRLGSATASRRGSLVASPPLTLRSRAGSVAASSGIILNRNAVYEYI